MAVGNSLKGWLRGKGLYGGERFGPDNPEWQAAMNRGDTGAAQRIATEKYGTRPEEDSWLARRLAIPGRIQKARPLSNLGDLFSSLGWLGSLAAIPYTLARGTSWLGLGKKSAPEVPAGSATAPVSAADLGDAYVAGGSALPGTAAPVAKTGLAGWSLGDVTGPIMKNPTAALANLAGAWNVIQNVGGNMLGIDALKSSSTKAYDRLERQADLAEANAAYKRQVVEGWLATEYPGLVRRYATRNRIMNEAEGYIPALEQAQNASAARAGATGVSMRPSTVGAERWYRGATITGRDAAENRANTRYNQLLSMLNNITPAEVPDALVRLAQTQTAESALPYLMTDEEARKALASYMGY